MNALAGMNIIVSGGASGIGLAIARNLLAKGARVCVTGRSADKLRALQAELGRDGIDVEVRSFDVTDRPAVFSAVAELLASWGRIDGLVNNAGVYKSAAFLDFAAEDFENLFQTNVMGCVNLMQAVLPHLLTQRAGRIVNIASTAGKWGSMNQSAYNVSKHALVGLTRCVALETAAHGVTVNAICPGLVATDMMHELLARQAQAMGTDKDSLQASLEERIPLRRAIRPEEIGELAAYLLSPGAAGMTGQSILYDGGLVMT
ncbi:SDR family NAD(P)-dependent oxidoreductase [Pseudomonas piscis]|uniref:SDR family NAD(P)-dependent oxidoreductase n=1 Tax=Pseudomonas piscis TaxID=2614538 RepID=UPI0039A67F69